MSIITRVAMALTGVALVVSGAGTAAGLATPETVYPGLGILALLYLAHRGPGVGAILLASVAVALALVNMAGPVPGVTPAVHLVSRIAILAGSVRAPGRSTRPARA